MRIFKTRLFHQWAKKIGLNDTSLCKATEELAQGLYEANLGGYLYKKRLAFGGKGKSGGLRTIIAFKQEDKAFFVYGFAKNKKDNVTTEETEMLKKLAKKYLAYDEKQIQKAIESIDFIRVLQP